MNSGGVPYPPTPVIPGTLWPLLLSPHSAPDSRASIMYELLWPDFNPKLSDHPRNRKVGLTKEVNGCELWAGPAFALSRHILQSCYCKYSQRIKGNCGWENRFNELNENMTSMTKQIGALHGWMEIIHGNSRAENTNYWKFKKALDGFQFWIWQKKGLVNLKTNHQKVFNPKRKNKNTQKIQNKNPRTLKTCGIISGGSNSSNWSPRRRGGRCRGLKNLRK